MITGMIFVVKEEYEVSGFYTLHEATKIETDDTRLLQSMSQYGALLFRHCMDILTIHVDDKYEYPLQTLISELILDEYNQTLHPILVDEMLKANELPTCNINYDAFPDSVQELPYDMILGKMQGILHGAHALFIGSPVYYSPGMVLDMSQFFEFTSMDSGLIGYKVARDLYRELSRFFYDAANKQEPVFTKKS